jgi:hypothetical protein
MALTSVALDSARAKLNDQGAIFFTDAKLLPHLKDAHRELQVILWREGLPIINEVSNAITVAAGATTFGANLPTDIIEVLTIKERDVGSNDRYQDTTELEFIPEGMEQTDWMRYWAWQEEIVVMPGATKDRQMLIRYRKGLTIPTQGSDPIGFAFGELYLGPRTAALMAGALGNKSTKTELTSEAEMFIEMVVAANVRAQQTLPARRLPYRWNRRRR